MFYVDINELNRIEPPSRHSTSPAVTSVQRYFTSHFTIPCSWPCTQRHDLLAPSAHLFLPFLFQTIGGDHDASNNYCTVFPCLQIVENSMPPLPTISSSPRSWRSYLRAWQASHATSRKTTLAADALNHRLPSLEAMKDGLRRRWFGRSEAASPQREASGRSFDFKKEGGPCLETGKERGSED